MRATAPLRILLVEDHADTRVIFTMLLTRMGHDVVAVGDASAAHVAVAESRPDLVISDMGLPRLEDGVELMRSLVDQGMRGIAITGHLQPSDQQAARDAGCLALIAKPASIEEVAAAIALAMS